jgi:hypothetical protein
MTQDERITLIEGCQRFLQDPAFPSILGALQRIHQTDWLQSEDSEAREELWFRAKGIELLYQFIREVAAWPRESGIEWAEEESE